jgi:exodeoxyribonuclease X
MGEAMLVIDTETTGFDTSDEVVEAAAIWIQAEDKLRLGHFSTLIKPRAAKMNVEARAIHHILDHELEKAPALEESGLLEMLAMADIHVGHSAEFDRRLLTQSGVANLPARYICTWRCALHLYPDCPSHKNQVLRYYLDLDVPPVSHYFLPHRALSDAYVTSGLLLRMLETHTIEELVKLSQTPALLKTVKFGKNRGQLWQDQDMGFLAWVLSKKFGEDERYTAKHWLTIKRKEHEERIQAASSQNGNIESQGPG